MNKTTKLLLVAVSALMIAFVAAGSIISAQDKQDELYQKFDIFVEVLNKIRNEYVEPVDPSAIFDGALKGMAAALDAESSYLTAGDYEQYKAETALRTAETGIKVMKHQGNRYAVVTHVLPGSPADKAGIRRGDLIRAIDGVSTTEMPIMMIELHLKGEPGTKTRLSVIRGGVQGLLSFELEHKDIDRTSFASSVEDGAGYIKINSFDSFILEELEAACFQFEQEGIDTLILDIRDNISRNLEEAVHCAELFVSGGKILSVTSKDGSLDYTANEPAFDFKLLILTNSSTARAAEAFAVALKDLDRAEIIGEKTIGVATLQREITLEDGAYINISYGTFVGPQGTVVHGEGVEPDVEVEQQEDDQDEILAEALRRAKNPAEDKEAA